MLDLRHLIASLFSWGNCSVTEKGRNWSHQKDVKRQKRVVWGAKSVWKKVFLRLNFRATIFHYLCMWMMHLTSFCIAGLGNYANDTTFSCMCSSIPELEVRLWQSSYIGGLKLTGWVSILKPKLLLTSRTKRAQASQGKNGCSGTCEEQEGQVLRCGIGKWSDVASGGSMSGGSVCVLLVWQNWVWLNIYCLPTWISFTSSNVAFYFI